MDETTTRIPEDGSPEKEKSIFQVLGQHLDCFADDRFFTWCSRFITPAKAISAKGGAYILRRS
jgi:hypothetical protein